MLRRFMILSREATNDDVLQVYNANVGYVSLVKLSFEFRPVIHDKSCLHCISLIQTYARDVKKSRATPCS